MALLWDLFFGGRLTYQVRPMQLEKLSRLRELTGLRKNEHVIESACVTYARVAQLTNGGTKEAYLTDGTTQFDLSGILWYQHPKPTQFGDEPDLGKPTTFKCGWGASSRIRSSIQTAEKYFRARARNQHLVVAMGTYELYIDTFPSQRHVMFHRVDDSLEERVDLLSAKR